MWIEILVRPLRIQGSGVTLFTGVWIEIFYPAHDNRNQHVTLFTGVWIEIPFVLFVLRTNTSHSSRVCGLKFCLNKDCGAVQRVTLFTGVWIEIKFDNLLCRHPVVTLFTGVWIEIQGI